MRIIIMIVFFVGVQILAAHFTFASDIKAPPISAREAQRRAAHEKLVTDLRKAKKADKEKLAGQPAPSVQAKGEKPLSLE